MLCFGVIGLSLNEGQLWCGMGMWIERNWRRDLRRVRWLKASGWMEVSLLEFKSHEIEWEGVDVEWWLSVKVKTGQTVESIEHTRREGGDGVGVKCMREGIDCWKGNEDDWKGGLMNVMERVVSLLRLENSPDVRESRWLLYNDDWMWNGSEKEMRGRCGMKWSKGG